jgi:hypothetical protein
VTRWHGRNKLQPSLRLFLSKEDVSDIVPALAFLTAGVIDQFCDDSRKASELVTA